MVFLVFGFFWVFEGESGLSLKKRVEVDVHCFRLFSKKLSPGPPPPKKTKTKNSLDDCHSLVRPRCVHPEVELVRVARLGLAGERLERRFLFVKVGRPRPVVGLFLEEAEAGSAGPEFLCVG